MSRNTFRATPYAPFSERLSIRRLTAVSTKRRIDHADRVNASDARLIAARVAVADRTR